VHQQIMPGTGTQQGMANGIQEKLVSVSHQIWQARNKAQPGASR